MLKTFTFKNDSLLTLLNKIKLHLKGGVVTIKPKGKLNGYVLISYITFPLIYPKDTQNGHTNRWECKEIANLFLEKGYEVHVIDLDNKTFLPKVKYDFFIDNGTNLVRLFPFMTNSIKIYHATTCDAEFQNNAEMQRIKNIKKRRGVTLKARRILPITKSPLLANYITVLGNEMTKNTYRYTNKKIVSIPLSTTHTFPFPAEKDFDKARNSFVWVGGAGMVHKGLDLVLEAFKDMPEMNLSIFGNINAEEDFVKEYKNELSLPNIKTYGKIDMGGEIFKNIADNSVAIVSPSCSEGGGGSVITSMHKGLIPIVTYESSVNTEDFGILMKNGTVEEIKEAVRDIAEKSKEELKDRSLKAWEYARAHHTREIFSKSYKNFIEYLQTKNNEHQTNE